jgi:hypothetical protein
MLLVETSVDDLGDIFRMGICPYCESGSIRDEIYKWAIPPMGTRTACDAITGLLQRNRVAASPPPRLRTTSTSVCSLLITAGKCDRRNRLDGLFCAAAILSGRCWLGVMTGPTPRLGYVSFHRVRTLVRENGMHGRHPRTAPRMAPRRCGASPARPARAALRATSSTVPESRENVS